MTIFAIRWYEFNLWVSWSITLLIRVLFVSAPPVLELILSETYCRNHYLAGLLLQQVHQQMCDVYSSNSVKRTPFVILRNLLSKHLFDDRYNANANAQARIAVLYLPLISIILENQKALCLPGNVAKALSNVA